MAQELARRTYNQLLVQDLLLFAQFFFKFSNKKIKTQQNDVFVSKFLHKNIENFSHAVSYVQKSRTPIQKNFIGQHHFIGAKFYANQVS